MKPKAKFMKAIIRGRRATHDSLRVAESRNNFAKQND